MANPTFQIFIGKDGQSRFRFIDPNGESVLLSEGYSSADDCIALIQQLQLDPENSNRYKKITMAQGHYFNLFNSSGELIGTSRMYSTENDRNNGISLVMHRCKLADLQDLT